MRIGQLAEQAGVSVRALRYYEEQGLLAPDRSASGQRHYPDSAVERVQLFQQLYSVGLSSRTIRSVLPCVDRHNESTAADALHLLVEQRGRIDEQIARLIDTRGVLDGLISANEAALADASGELDHRCDNLAAAIG